MGRKKCLTLHSLSRMIGCSGSRDEKAKKKSGKRQKLNAVKNAAKICMVTKTVLTLHPLFGASDLMIVKPEKKEHIETITIDIKSSTREQKCTRSILDPISSVLTV